MSYEKSLRKCGKTYKDQRKHRQVVGGTIQGLIEHEKRVVRRPWRNNKENYDEISL